MKSIVAVWMFLAATAVLSGCAVSPATSPSTSTGARTPTGVVVGPGPATTVCCREFPDELSRRVHPVLAQIPNLTRLQRLRTTDGSLCYRFRYEGALEALEARLASELPTSTTLPFRIERGGDGRLIDLVFDGGFE